MPFLLNDKIPVFPSPLYANDEGLLAVGGKVSPDFLEEAYKLGIFPWFSEGTIPMWWSPDPRPVFFPGEVKISKSMRQWIRRHKSYRVSVNRAFDQVLEWCAKVPRKEGEGTWLSEELRKSILVLYHKGLAQSVEVWNGEGRLAGGLYGIKAGKNRNVFSGESMFSLEPNTSKFALIYLVQNAQKMGFKLIDGQVESSHLIRMGAKLVPARRFLNEFILNKKL